MPDIMSMGSSVPRLHLREDDVVRLVLEFICSRQFHISQLSLERETGVINGVFSDDVLFLRQLILDGQWDDVTEFIQPLEAIASFDARTFHYLILRQKYVELLCIKSEAGLIANVDTAVEEVVKVLSDLEKLCPSREIYNHLCLLLTLPKLIDHADYQDWNPSSARVRCFQDIYPLVEKFLPYEKPAKDGHALQEATNDRLIHLLIKGLLYESCVEFCQRRALSGSVKERSPPQLRFGSLLSSTKKFHDSDLSLLSWLQSIPAQTFAHPFEQRTLDVDVERLDKPTLETSWTEHMLVTPIKPKLFPYSAMPFGRPRSVDLMSRSLNPSLDGLPFGSGTMWRSSLASFHLTGKKSMTTSVDRLFESDEKGSKIIQPPSISTVSELAKEHSPFDDEDNKRVIATDVLEKPPRAEPASGDLLREFQRLKYSPGTTSNKLAAPPPQVLSEPTNEPTDDKPQLPANQNGSAASTSGPTSGSGSLGSGSVSASTTMHGSGLAGKPRFIAVTSLDDAQAVRCAEFHPSGRLYAVGSNSKTLRICSYPKLSDLRDDHTTCQSTVLFKRTKHHKGSIYCLAWSPAGDLIATGSNDKTVKLMRFNADTCNVEGQEIELSMHDGTVRDVCFIEDMSNKSSLLVSGGAGDCKIYVTDCVTGTPFQALTGHSGHVLSLYTWGGAMFISGSQDKTVRMWDLRTRGCVNMITPLTTPSSPVNKGSPVASVAVDPSGRLMVSGHEDASCILYDIRGNRTIQSFKPHTADVRSVRFSPSAYYLLTGGYDNKLVLTDLQGDLTMSLPSIVVAQHQDKVISGRWHPNEFSFISSSADKTSALWALPPL